MTTQQVYSLRLCGIGGQGIVSLSSAVARAAVKQGLSVSVIDRPRSAMRLGPITCDVRFGKPDCAAFIPMGTADAVLALEPLDGVLNAARLIKKRGTLLLSSTESPTIDELVSGERDKRREDWIELVKKHGALVVSVNASAEAEQATGNAINANFFLIGVLCQAEKRFPVLPETLLGELKGGMLAAFEAGLAYSL